MTDEDHKGVVASITSLGETALAKVPAALLVLVALNVAFIGFTTWLEIAQNASRERVLATIIAGCIK